MRSAASVAMAMGLLGGCGNAAAPGPAKVGSGVGSASGVGSGSASGVGSGSAAGSGSASGAGSGSAAGSGSGSAALPPVATSCTEASFAIVHADQLSVFDISPACAVTLAATWPAPADRRLLSAAWPSRRGPLYVAASAGDEPGASGVLRFDQPRVAGGPAPTAMPPVGKGDVEPEGYTFAVVADDRGAYVERCKQWGEPCPECEEVEEWPCQQHTYFPVAGGKQLKAAVALDRFALPLAGGLLGGQLTLTRVDRTTLTCSVAGGAPEQLSLSEYGPNEFVVAPLSPTSFLLGQEQPGGRMYGARSVDYVRVDRCVERSTREQVAVGPGGLWAVTPGDGLQASDWTLHQGELPLASPALIGHAVVWTR